MIKRARAALLIALAIWFRRCTPTRANRRALHAHTERWWPYARLGDWATEGDVCSADPGARTQRSTCGCDTIAYESAV